MRLIAHRGNTKGRKKSLENSIDYLESALDQGFDVELDAWVTDSVYLGHDKPQYKCPMSFLISNSSKLWIHCKNLNALQSLNKIRSLNIFWHETDDFTLTSKGFIWTYPNKDVCENSVLVTESASDYKGAECFGLCSDYVG